MILGVDTGGTFTDFVLLSSAKEGDPKEGIRLTTHKVLSTPEAPERAILQGITEMGLAEDISAGLVKIIHGSTVATNAALEGKGVKTAFVTNTGFRDLLTIGRQTRPFLYRLDTPPLKPPVPRELCLEVKGRIDSKGHVLEILDADSLADLVRTLNTHVPEAIAVSLLFSFLAPEQERQIAEYLNAHLEFSPFISLSSEVLPEYREYERSIATWLNASLGPLVNDYLLKLKSGTHPSRLSIMQSSGGTIDADQASRKSVNLLLSGPAGGLAAASYLAQTSGQQKLMTFDMGGTSTDVAMFDGKINLTSEGQIGDYPVAVPMVDIHTIGAGGGSIASIDAGGLLQVGPLSAGASPGPACYSLSGTAPTVTDANLVLGRLLPEAFLGGTMTLDAKAASKALTRGFDPLDFRLCCFGGAGGLHICALAEAMGMTHAMVPVHAGVLSAMGMLLAPVERQLSRTYPVLLQNLDTAKTESIFTSLESEGLKQMAEEGILTEHVGIDYSADLRYAGQSASLTLPWVSEPVAENSYTFHEAHHQRYGHRLSSDVELVNLRISIRERKEAPVLEPFRQGAVTNTPIFETKVYGIAGKVPVMERDVLGLESEIRGPALITENNATTWIAPDW
ncbi:MAG: hydantoinase/oxoprolinase family protein, partial [Pseudomonadales bacterium]